MRYSEPNLTLALIIPSLREAESLYWLLPRVRAELVRSGIPWEVLVVDDDSDDGTAEIVHAASSHDSRIRLLVRKGERGLSGAILRGWQETSASVLGVMDADLQHPPELLPQLLDRIFDGYDMAIGSRYTPGGSCAEWHPLRRLFSSTAILVAMPLLRPWLRVCDPMSGFFLVRRAVVENGIYQPEGFKLLLEILATGRIRSVAEVPFHFGRRRAGFSKATVRVAWDYLRLLARLYRTCWPVRHAYTDIPTPQPEPASPLRVVKK
jgi:dolichol-phosphate mannosyltransferase